MEPDLPSLRIFSEDVHLWLTREAACLPRMCPKFRVENGRQEKLHPAASPAGLGPFLLSLFLLKPDGPAP